MRSEKRQIVAVLAADVEGFSRHMESDEAGTTAALMARREIFDRLIQLHDGQIVNTAGDSVLARFGSTEDAVVCAVKVQEALFEHGRQQPSNIPSLKFRIGVDIGDVDVMDDGDLLGRTVNLAARLQTTADPGGVCISERAHEQVNRVLPLRFLDIGTPSLKNLSAGTRVFRVDFNKSDQVAPEKRFFVPSYDGTKMQQNFTAVSIPGPRDAPLSAAERAIIVATRGHLQCFCDRLYAPRPSIESVLLPKVDDIIRTASLDGRKDSAHLFIIEGSSAAGKSVALFQLLEHMAADAAVRSFYFKSFSEVLEASRLNSEALKDSYIFVDELTNPDIETLTHETSILALYSLRKSSACIFTAYTTISAANETRSATESLSHIFHLHLLPLGEIGIPDMEAIAKRIGVELQKGMQQKRTFLDLFDNLLPDLLPVHVRNAVDKLVKTGGQSPIVATLIAIQMFDPSTVGILTHLKIIDQDDPNIKSLLSTHGAILRRALDVVFSTKKLGHAEISQLIIALVRAISSREEQLFVFVCLLRLQKFLAAPPSYLSCKQNPFVFAGHRLLAEDATGEQGARLFRILCSFSRRSLVQRRAFYKSVGIEELANRLKDTGNEDARLSALFTQVKAAYVFEGISESRNLSLQCLPALQNAYDSKVILREYDAVLGPCWGEIAPFSLLVRVGTRQPYTIEAFELFCHLILDRPQKYLKKLAKFHRVLKEMLRAFPQANRAGAVFRLALVLEHRDRELEHLGLQFLSSHTLSTQTNANILAYLVGERVDQSESYAARFIDLYPTTDEASFLLPVLVDKLAEKPVIINTSIRWLDSYGAEKGAPYVAQAMMRRADADERYLDAVDSWLAKFGNHRGAHYAAEAIYKTGTERLFKTARTWLAKWSNTEGSAFVLTALAAGQSMSREDRIDVLLDWLSKSEGLKARSYVYESLFSLVRGKDDFEKVRHIFGGKNEYSQIWIIVGCIVYSDYLDQELLNDSFAQLEPRTKTIISRIIAKRKRVGFTTRAQSRFEAMCAATGEALPENWTEIWLTGADAG